MPERWLPVVGHPGYEVSDQRRVRRDEPDCHKTHYWRRSIFGGARHVSGIGAVATVVGHPHLATLARHASTSPH
jgi:hypothetical protein